MAERFAVGDRVSCARIDSDAASEPRFQGTVMTVDELGFTIEYDEGSPPGRVSYEWWQAHEFRNLGLDGWLEFLNA